MSIAYNRRKKAIKRFLMIGEHSTELKSGEKQTGIAFVRKDGKYKRV